MVLSFVAVFTLVGMIGCCTIQQEAADSLSKAWDLIEADAIGGVNARLAKVVPLVGETRDQYFERVARMKTTELRHIQEFGALIKQLNSGVKKEARSAK